MLRRLTVLVIAVLALFAAAVPQASAASSRYMSRTTGQNANAYWTQVDNTPVGSQFGNVHVGYLYAYETSKNVGDVFVYIDDYDCQPGVLPNGGHGGAAPGCDWVGSRFGDGFGLGLVIDRKLNTATLTGTLVMSVGGDHGPGQVVGQPGVNMVWTGFGSTARTMSNYRYTDGTSSYTDRYRATERQATLGGNLGPMTFAPSLSGGTISSFTQSSRGRS